MIKQGDIFWLNLTEPKGSEPGFRRPVLVIQGDPFNKSAIKTAVVCVLTTNLSRGEAPGNVLLKKTEGGLKKPSVVNASQLLTVNKVDLKEKIGTLSAPRIVEVIAGINVVLGRP